MFKYKCIKICTNYYRVTCLYLLLQEIMSVDTIYLKNLYFTSGFKVSNLCGTFT
jgi:hypothetical protein